jgi:tetratricopeptide (TPR) repeat protein
MFGLFGKKKKNGEDKQPLKTPPAPAAPPPASAAAAKPAAPAPKPTPAGAPAGSPAAQTQAALVSRAGPKSAPPSGESAEATAGAIASLLADSDPVAQAAAKNLAAGAVEKALDSLEQDARGATQNGAEKWRRIGALAFGVDAGRAMIAYEEAFHRDRKHFWTGVFLARLRGLGGKLDGARDCALAALAAAETDDHKGLALAEFAMIAIAQNQGAEATKAAAQAAIAADAALKANPSLAQERTLMARHYLHGDAATTHGDHAAAKGAYEKGLTNARRLGAAAPTDAILALAVADGLEKLAAALARSGDAQGAVNAAEESLALRRKLAAQMPNGVQAIAAGLSTLGEAKRALGDLEGARAAFQDSLALSREAAKAAPQDSQVQRELWGALWRLAQMGGAGVSWRDVVAAMETMAAQGVLQEGDKRFLGEAKRRAEQA